LLCRKGPTIATTFICETFVIPGTIFRAWISLVVILIASTSLLFCLFLSASSRCLCLDVPHCFLTLVSSTRGRACFSRLASSAVAPLELATRAWWIINYSYYSYRLSFPMLLSLYYHIKQPLLLLLWSCLDRCRTASIIINTIVDFSRVSMLTSRFI